MLKVHSHSDVHPPMDVLKEAIDVLENEAEALHQLGACLDENFVYVAQALLKLSGRLIVSGMGKSGHIGKKIAATLSSTGQPSYFVHAAEANHGDLGMITKDDALLILSASGETEELHPMLAYGRRLGIPIVAITKNKESALSSCAHWTLLLPSVPEACPMNLAPTTSTTMMLALGDALAVCLLKMRGFSKQDYGIFHPGGSLGQQLTTVGDKMHQGRELPLTSEERPIKEVLREMTTKKFGCIGVVNGENTLTGMITDGDIRRFLTKGEGASEFASEKEWPEVFSATMCAKNLMTKNPITVTPSTLMADALRLMQDKSITALFIVNEGNQPTGLVHIHDFLKNGIL